MSIDSGAKTLRLRSKERSEARAVKSRVDFRSFERSGRGDCDRVYKHLTPNGVKTSDLLLPTLTSAVTRCIRDYNRENKAQSTDRSVATNPAR